MSEDDSISCRAAGRKGGEYIRDTYGSEHYERMGRLGAAKTLEKHGIEHMRRIGKRGGQANAARRGAVPFDGDEAMDRLTARRKQPEAGDAD